MGNAEYMGMKSVRPELVLAYISMEVNSGGDHGNLVVFQPGVDADQFRKDKGVKSSGHPPHGVARYYYSSIRIHRCILNLNKSTYNLDEDETAGILKINSTTSLHFHHPIILNENGKEDEGNIRRPFREIIHWIKKESGYEIVH